MALELQNSSLLVGTDERWDQPALGVTAHAVALHIAARQAEPVELGGILLEAMIASGADLNSRDQASRVPLRRAGRIPGEKLPLDALLVPLWTICERRRCHLLFSMQSLR